MASKGKPGEVESVTFHNPQVLAQIHSLMEMVPLASDENASESIVERILAAEDWGEVNVGREATEVDSLAGARIVIDGIVRRKSTKDFGQDTYIAMFGHYAGSDDKFWFPVASAVVQVQLLKLWALDAYPVVGVYTVVRTSTGRDAHNLQILGAHYSPRTVPGDVE